MQYGAWEPIPGGHKGGRRRRNSSGGYDYDYDAPRSGRAENVSESSTMAKRLLQAAVAEHGAAEVKAAAKKAAVDASARVNSVLKDRAVELAASKTMTDAVARATKGKPDANAVANVAKDPSVRSLAKREIGTLTSKISDAIGDAALKATGEKRPSKWKAVLRSVLRGGIGAFAFGFIDNFILYLAGASMDHAFAAMGFSAAAVAGVGNAVSDSIGEAFSQQIDDAFEKMGLGEGETSGAISERAESRIKKISGVVGIFSGAIAGMIPMLFGVSFGKSERAMNRLHFDIDDWLEDIEKSEQLSLFGADVSSKTGQGNLFDRGAKKNKELGLAPRPARQNVKPKVESHAKRPPGAGWEPIPNGHHGGFRRRKANGRGFDHWYPDREGVSNRPHRDDVDDRTRQLLSAFDKLANRKDFSGESVDELKDLKRAASIAASQLYDSGIDVTHEMEEIHRKIRGAIADKRVVVSDSVMKTLEGDVRDLGGDIDRAKTDASLDKIQTTLKVILDGYADDKVVASDDDIKRRLESLRTAASAALRDVEARRKVIAYERKKESNALTPEDIDASRFFAKEEKKAKDLLARYTESGGTMSDDEKRKLKSAVKRQMKRLTGDDAKKHLESNPNGLDVAMSALDIVEMRIGDIPRKKRTPAKPKKSTVDVVEDLARELGIPMERVGARSVALGGPAAAYGTTFKGKWNRLKGPDNRKIASAAAAKKWIEENYDKLKASKESAGGNKRTFYEEIRWRQDRHLGIRGNTYPIRDKLKAAGAIWDRKEKEWLMPDEETLHEFTDEAMKVAAATGTKPTVFSPYDFNEHFFDMESEYGEASSPPATQKQINTLLHLVRRAARYDPREVYEGLREEGVYTREKDMKELTSAEIERMIAQMGSGYYQ